MATTKSFGDVIGSLPVGEVTHLLGHDEDGTVRRQSLLDVTVGPEPSSIAIGASRSEPVLQQQTAFSRLKSRLDARLDATVLVIGDSTSYGPYLHQYSLTFSSVAVNATLVLEGVTFTFVASAATESEITIGGTAADTATATAAAIAAHSNPALRSVSAIVDPQNSARLLLSGTSTIPVGMVISASVTGSGLTLAVAQQRPGWLDYFVGHLAESYPTHHVIYNWWQEYLVGTGSTSYASRVLQTGTIGQASGISSIGTNTRATLRIYNASIPGSRTGDFLSSVRRAAVTDIPRPDIIIYNHGHNIENLSSTDAAGNLYAAGRGSIGCAIASYHEVWPETPVAWIIQTPWRDTSTSTGSGAQKKAKVKEWSRYVMTGLPYVTPVDFYTAFMRHGLSDKLYFDNIHPGPLGHRVMWSALLNTWEQAKSEAPLTPDRWTVKAAPRNSLLFSDDFQTFSSGTPTGWTKSANITCSRDTTRFDVGYAQSLKVAGTGSTSSTLSRSTSVSSYLAGSEWCAVARVFIPTGCANWNFQAQPAQDDWPGLTSWDTSVKNFMGMGWFLGSTNSFKFL